MKYITFVYIFVLFVLLTPSILFKIPIKNNLLVSCVHSLIFSLFLFLTYEFVNNTIENLETDNKSTLEKILNKIFNKFPKKRINYSVHNVVYELDHTNHDKFSDITHNGETVNFQL